VTEACVAFTAQCKAVVTCNQGVRGGRVTELKATVDAAVKVCPTVQHVFVSQRTETPAVMGRLDVPLEQAMSRQSPVCPPEPLDSEDILFLLYTSGSTGKPKGIVHTQAGYLLYCSLTHQYVFDHRPGDVFGCVADVGWITGHSYVVYGPLSNGATSLLYESTPVYPDPGRYWETVERLSLTQFYGAPTALRLLLKYDDSWVKKYDRSSLRTLASGTTC
ncbi:acetyl-coenzyme A synthetase 2-like, mitochondrial, partial [Etheostoma cragini]|uniref:acetyl-coenzyme A synthetase 2-like, mitochondrial n=1 Tax=Etheostoma cragini TaxID=417921 RepID=UPI00155EA609